VNKIITKPQKISPAKALDQMFIYIYTHTHTHNKLGIIYKEVMSEGNSCSEFYTWVPEMLVKKISRQKKAEGSFFTIMSLLILHNSEVFYGKLLYDLIQTNFFCSLKWWWPSKEEYFRILRRIRMNLSSEWNTICLQRLCCTTSRMM
jgi:hypothetical protein